MTQEQQITHRFHNLGIGDYFLDILKQKGFDIPTPIQRKVIPSALEGKDVVGIAQTGTGKTLAFGIPMIQRILPSKKQGLIITPTRELALQIERALKDVGAQLGLRCAVVIGGTPQYPQVRALKSKPHIIIGTPGRLVDLMNQGYYSLDKVNTIILDEADRMLDVGFLPEIRRLLQSAPKDRQTMLFSATMPQSISSLASEFMRIPLRIEIDPQGTSSEKTEQELFVVRKNDKMRLLDSVLQEYLNDKVLIFSRTKHGAKRIARDIRNMGHTATEIHSNRSQAQRKVALEGFTKGKFRIMVATDIAARGIDVKDISLVINFDLPDNSEDYVHRIGRTGRAGRYGKAISFVTPSQKADVKKIEFLIRKSLPIISLPLLPPERQRPPQTEQRRFSRGNQHTGQGHGNNYSYQKSQKRSSQGHRNYSHYRR
ncbi:MAG: DEAD/DEAH box helicase [bacterium]